MRFPLLCPILFALAAPGEATTVLELSTRQIVNLSSRAVLGKVIARRCHRLAGGMIATTVRIEVERDLRGSAPRGRVLSFTFPGGRLGDLRSAIPGMPSFAVGESVVLFTNRPAALGTCLPIGLAQGKYQVQRDPRSGKRYVVRSLAGLRLLDPRSGKIVRPGARAARVPLESFLAQVDAIVREGR